MTIIITVKVVTILINISKKKKDNLKHFKSDNFEQFGLKRYLKLYIFFNCC